MINILVTGAGGGVGQGIIKSLKMIYDLDINIIAADMSPLATGIYSGNKAYLVPACTADNYLMRLADIFTSENIQYYFPGTDVELSFCALNKVSIKENYNVEVVISNMDAVLISDDKYKTFEFLRDNGFTYPETFLEDEVNIDKISYPVIVKPAVGCRSIGVGIVNNKVDLKRRLLSENGLIIQELIGTDADEYTCTVVIANNKVSDVLILRRVLRSGDTFRAEPIKSEVISNYVKSVALALNVNGSCNFQLRIDKNGIPKIFEINCRFSGTTPFCSQLGFNPVEFYLKNIMNIEYKYNIDYNRVVLRYWSEVVVDKNIVESLDENQEISPSFFKKVSLFEK